MLPPPLKLLGGGGGACPPSSYAYETEEISLPYLECYCYFQDDAYTTNAEMASLGNFELRLTEQRPKNDMIK